MTLQSLSELGKVPVEFVTTLLEPFTDQAAHIEKVGIANYTWTILKNGVQAVRAHPLNLISFIGPHLPTHMVTSACTTILSTIRGGKSLQNLARSICPSRVGKGAAGTIACSALLVLILFVPGAGAHAPTYNSLSEVSARYDNGGPCSPEMDAPFERARECLKNDINLDTCRTFLSPERNATAIVFGRHPNGACSVVELSPAQGEQTLTCTYTALDDNGPVTRTCFSKGDLTDMTVEKVENMSKAEAQAGLKPGTSVIHLETYDHIKNAMCGSRASQPANQEVHSDTQCILTSLKKGDPVSKLCFPKGRPELLTVEEAVGVKLDLPDGKPVAMVLPTSRPTICSNVLPPSMWKAVKWWWTGECPHE